MDTQLKQNESKRISRLVPVWYFQAFGLKIMGLTYETIARECGKSVSAVEKLFYSKGFMYNYWQEWSKERKDRNSADAMDMIFGHLPEYTRAAIMVAKNTTNPMGVKQRERLFDYTLGKPVERTVNLNLDTSFADWVKQETLNDELEAKKLSQEPDPVV